MTAAVGAAILLATHRKTLCGSVRLLFQPDEEGCGGAQRFVDAGCLHGVDAVFGAHVSSELPLGSVGIRYGKFYAASDTFSITIRGKSAHGAEPEKGIDALQAAAQLAARLVSLRGALNGERCAVTVGTLQSGTAINIVADTAQLTGILRTLGPDSRVRMRTLVTDAAAEIAAQTGTQINVQLCASYPGIVNDDGASRLVHEIAMQLLGKPCVAVLQQPTLMTEDFGYYLSAAYGCFYHVGQAAPHRSILHNFYRIYVPLSLRRRCMPPCSNARWQNRTKTKDRSLIMGSIVVKFGDSSLATAGQFEKVATIIRENRARRYAAACAGEDFLPTLREIRQRFADIIAQLQVDLTADFETIASHLRSVPQRDYMASRGEYLNSKLLAAYLGVPFVDAAQMILFHADGSFDVETTNTNIAHKLANVERAVIPGFYGTLPDGMIHTFSCGGSDVAGSIIARAVGADLYENWTDVSGVLAADPRIVENPHIIDYITYRELRELSYMGASVLHEDAVFPVQQANISINVRNTNRPDDSGTFILSALPPNAHKRKVTGIAGHKGLSNHRLNRGSRREARGKQEFKEISR